MRENGLWLTGKNANFGGFAVLRHPIIDPHMKVLYVEYILYIKLYYEQRAEKFVVFLLLLESAIIGSMLVSLLSINSNERSEGHWKDG